MCRKKQSIIQNMFAIVVVVYASPLFASAYEMQESDFGHKIIYLESYEIVTKQGIDFKTNKQFQYQEGYLIYSEVPDGIATRRKAACLADICEKWTTDPKSFKHYVGKRANVRTSERFVNFKKNEECIMGIKIIK